MRVREKIKGILGSHGIVSFLALLLTLHLNFRFTHSTEFVDKKPLNPNLVYRMTPEFLRLVSFGYWTAAVDALWINVLGDIGRRDAQQVGAARFDELYDVGTQLDPYFYELYEQAGFFLSFVFEDADLALKYVNRGIAVYETGRAPPKFWTHPYTLYIQRAYIQAFLRFDWPAARAAYLAAEAIPGSPAYLKLVKSWLNSPESERILAIRVLKLLVRSTKDEVMRKRYEEKLRKYEP